MAVFATHNSPGRSRADVRSVKIYQSSLSELASNRHFSGDGCRCLQPILFLWGYSRRCRFVNRRCSSGSRDGILDCLTFHGPGNLLPECGHFGLGAGCMAARSYSHLKFDRRVCDPFRCPTGLVGRGDLTGAASTFEAKPVDTGKAGLAQAQIALNASIAAR